MQREPAQFLNLDLEIRSKGDLAPLAAYLKQRINLLHVGEGDGEFQLTAEPPSGGLIGQTAEKCTEELLSVLGALPKAQRGLFEDCHVRVFDYGFDGGLESPSLSVDLPAAQLRRICELGVSLRITVYPYRAEPLKNVREHDA